ncbi:MAG TPA: hypothetical protein VEW74_02065 [Candidatus Nitrosotalea sp.]|nr:hypothetical protein [Candidatus Nitrosotalea sp.]
MKSFAARPAAGSVAVMFLLTACASSASGVPNAGQAPAPMSRVAGDAKSTNLSGVWKGTQTDIAYGTGKATASYTQYQNSVGGVLTVKFANASASSSVALTVSGSSVNGTTVAARGGSFYCTFSTTSTYDPKTRVMSGSYSAVYGCTGDSGTFTLKHKCYYKGTGSAYIKPETGPRPC